MASNWSAVAVRTIDIARRLEPITDLARYSRVRVFVSRGDDLVGSVDIWTRGAASVSVSRLRDEIARQLGARLCALDVRKQLTPPETAPPRVHPQTVSVIVPTCERAADLRRCLESLVNQQTRHKVEIIVVDNRPSKGEGGAVVRDFPSVRLIVESRRGLSYARNAGIRHSTGSIIVTTDDDVVAPPGWIDRLTKPFDRPEVGAVTGHVLPVELETEAQYRFEAYGGLGKGFDPIEADRGWFEGRRSAVPTWNLGATANAAFRRSIFTRPDIGLLDEALGAGTPTGCSEDSYLFYRILKAGYTIVYEPSAYVWHRHRESMPALRAQIYAYSKGHVAYHVLTLLREGDTRALVRLTYSLPKTYLRHAWLSLSRERDYPVSWIALEIAGNLAGPLALWRSTRRVRRMGVSARLLEEGSDAVSLEGQTA